MLKAEQVVKMAEEAKKETSALLAAAPSDKRLRVVADGLDQVLRSIRAKWPMPAVEAKNLWLGLYAVRELEGVHDGLVDRLCSLDQRIKEASGVAR